MRRITVTAAAALAILGLTAAGASAQGPLQRSFEPPERTESGITGPTYSHQIDGGGSLSVIGPRVDLTGQKEGNVIILLPAVDHAGTGGGPH